MATAQAMSATMCNSRSPVQTRIGSPAGPGTHGGVTSRPSAADSQGNQAPRRPASSAAACAAGSRSDAVGEHRPGRGGPGGGEEGQHEDFRVPEDVASVRRPRQAARPERRLALPWRSSSRGGTGRSSPLAGDRHRRRCGCPSPSSGAPRLGVARAAVRRTRVARRGPGAPGRYRSSAACPVATRRPPGAPGVAGSRGRAMTARRPRRRRPARRPRGKPRRAARLPCHPASPSPCLARDPSRGSHPAALARLHRRRGAHRARVAPGWPGSRPGTARWCCGPRGAGGRCAGPGRGAARPRGRGLRPGASSPGPGAGRCPARRPTKTPATRTSRRAGAHAASGLPSVPTTPSTMASQLSRMCSSAGSVPLTSSVHVERLRDGRQGGSSPEPAQVPQDGGGIGQEQPLGARRKGASLAGIDDEHLARADSLGRPQRFDAPRHRPLAVAADGRDEHARPREAADERIGLAPWPHQEHGLHRQWPGPWAQAARDAGGATANAVNRT